jgi:hypothetical protein
MENPATFSTRLQPVHTLQQGVGFKDGKQYSIKSYKAMADAFEEHWLATKHFGAFGGDPVTGDINVSIEQKYAAYERDYWNVVETNTEQVVVEYGNDINTLKYCSGFPSKFVEVETKPVSGGSKFDYCHPERATTVRTPLSSSSSSASPTVSAASPRKLNDGEGSPGSQGGGSISQAAATSAAAFASPSHGEQQNSCIAPNSNQRDDGRSPMDAALRTEAEPVGIKDVREIRPSQPPSSDNPHLSNANHPVFPDEYYQKSGWNLNNTAAAVGSLLRHLKAPVNGVNVPWLYIGMLFTSFCWHTEDNYFYSINYNHFGSGKMWYGVPSSAAPSFERVSKEFLHGIFKDSPDVLQYMTLQVSPSLLLRNGVPVYKIVQEPGTFIVTFPQGYHAGFSLGFNVGEAVNFVTIDWVPKGG